MVEAGTVFIGIVVAVVEMIQQAFEQNWRVVATILGAGVTGGLLGALGVQGLDPLTGVALGLAASGVVTVAKKV